MGWCMRHRDTRRVRFIAHRVSPLNAPSPRLITPHHPSPTPSTPPAFHPSTISHPHRSSPQNSIAISIPPRHEISSNPSPLALNTPLHPTQHPPLTSSSSTKTPGKHAVSRPALQKAPLETDAADWTGSEEGEAE
ncbi:hypothetical protein EX30DRAFT_342835 [Ascodesmis nigricans]|uniref:Uncharacterized protein n=1 Tax=Ascodesmis nigricans TaxID=341454 RepID=A0A4S2MRQ5_9PEZI|nr:hypothetical protein EX30DRAFT_342835 [Ascodesmis nigricans]